LDTDSGGWRSVVTFNYNNAKNMFEKGLANKSMVSQAMRLYFYETADDKKYNDRMARIDAVRGIMYSLNDLNSSLVAEAQNVLPTLTEEELNLIK